MEISDNIKKNPEVVERFKAMLKKAIDDHSCVEVLEVGFRRGVEWYVFESGLHIAKELIELNSQLLKENADLKEALQRQVKEQACQDVFFRTTFESWIGQKSSF